MISEATDLGACRGCHCLAARKYARAVTRHYDAHLRAHGLKVTQFSVLAAIAIKGRGRVTALASVLGLERTTLTRVASILERDGLVRAVPAEDARQHVFELTPAGRRKLERAYGAWKAAQQAAETHFQVSDRPRALRAPTENG